MDWKDCKNLLIIRPDNMGDVLMSSPAIRVLRNFTGARISLLTSSKGAGIARLNPDVDEVIVFDLPWVKTDSQPEPKQLAEIVTWLRLQSFDGCILFTVYSQNPLPAAMIAYMAEIPLRLAYCRENPYGLLTHWLPDQEPYNFIRHQVERDLGLVAHIGATAPRGPLIVAIPPESLKTAAERLNLIGFDLRQRYMIIHPGVSEARREYPLARWVTCGRELIKKIGMPLLITGSGEERELAGSLALAIGTGAYNAAGLLDLAEFSVAVRAATAMISVNTGAVHLAAAVQTPVVVLYAQTNPQHTPWMVPNVVLEYTVPNAMKSKNEVVMHVDRLYYSRPRPFPAETTVVHALQQLLNGQIEMTSEK